MSNYHIIPPLPDEEGMDLGQRLLLIHRLEDRCLELRKLLAVAEGAPLREALGEEAVYLGNLRLRHEA